MACFNCPYMAESATWDLLEDPRLTPRLTMELVIEITMSGCPRPHVGNEAVGDDCHVLPHSHPYRPDDLAGHPEPQSPVTCMRLTADCLRIRGLSRPMKDDVGMDHPSITYI